MAEHDLSLRDLVKVYDDRTGERAVDGVWLDVGKGEFVSLLGPSGSGKTTTLMMIAGFEDPSSGDILVDGNSILGVPTHLRDIGLVFQNYALFPKMTVAQNIAFPLRMRRQSRSAMAEAVERSLDLIDLRGFGDRYPKQLSGGQQQRVALARALAFDPRLLLLDEPMGALDRKLREQMQLEVKKIQRRLGVTTIYVTHDQEEAMVLSDRVAIMNRGRIEQVGRPVQMYNRPVNRFVAQFLGEANLLPATVERTQDGSHGFALLNGAVVPFTVHEALPGGSHIDLFIRPECVLMDRENAHPLAGVVESIVFLGSATRYAVRAEAIEIVATRHNRQEGPDFTVGEKVSLSWDANRAVALPAE
jgi:spermidine/putrescine ABC transporter ATP-binding subunit